MLNYSHRNGFPSNVLPGGLFSDRPTRISVTAVPLKLEGTRIPKSLEFTPPAISALVCLVCLGCVDLDFSESEDRIICSPFPHREHTFQYLCKIEPQINGLWWRNHCQLCILKRRNIPQCCLCLGALQCQEGGERDEWRGWAGLGWASLPRWELLGERLIRCQAKCFTCINSSNPHSSLETYRSYYNPPLHQAAEARGG